MYLGQEYFVFGDWFRIHFTENEGMAFGLTLGGDYGKIAALQEVYYRTDNNLTFQARGWIQKNRRNLPPLMSYEGSPRTEYQKDDQYRLNIGAKKYSEKISAVL